MTLFQPLRSVIRRKLHPRREVILDTSDDLNEAAHWIERPILRMFVPPHLLRMQGAMAYDEEHPFVAALLKGVQELRRFYVECQPRDLCEYHLIDGRGRLGANMAQWELPWYGRSARTPPPGEGGLGPAHGVSYYGPVSEAKLVLEMKRLHRVESSIRRNGYKPDVYGDIEGYILNDGQRSVFFVRGGKHRAAALTALGNQRIPVVFKSYFPRMVHSAEAATWPLVRQGKIESTLAKEVLETYTRDRIRLGSGNGSPS
jgi:hypothetical protein